jgi:hypothetical protein
VPTILQRLTESIRLSVERAEMHLRSGYVRVDGEVVKDPAAEVGEDARITLQPEPVTEQT